MFLMLTLIFMAASSQSFPPWLWILLVLVYFEREV